eukprot:UN27059
MNDIKVFARWCDTCNDDTHVKSCEGGCGFYFCGKECHLWAWKFGDHKKLCKKSKKNKRKKKKKKKKKSLKF